MSKVALYRKYRPETFNDVIDQEMIVKVLTNQIKKGSISHAYLFCGSRGTGKTSSAKVFAKAINCPTPIDGSPCLKCSVCESLKTATNLDIIEMDAASNNGVDDIRQLRDVIGYMPAYGKYKVYIIDEVHMLSNAAFNALLKTLEEPPAHVVFILCTTEAHKLPATILSRCMRFDFSLVTTQKLAEHVKVIFASEGRKIDDDAALHIAKLGEGSVRDVLSIADRCINFDEHLSLEQVLRITGSASLTQTAALMVAVINSNAKDILLIIEQMSNSGKNISLIAREIMKYARDLMAVLNGAESLVLADSNDISQMRDIAKTTDNAFLVNLVRVISNVDSELRYSISPKIVLESSLLSLCVSPTANKPASNITAINVNQSSAAVAVPQSSGQSAIGVTIARADSTMHKAEVPAKSMTAMEEELFNDTQDKDKAKELLGGIYKSLRSGEPKYFPLYGEWRNVTASDVTTIGNIFIAFVGERLQLKLCDPEYFSHVSNILAQSGYELKVELAGEQRKEDKIKQLLAAVGDSGVLVDKKGRVIKE